MKIKHTETRCACDGTHFQCNLVAFVSGPFWSFWDFLDFLNFLNFFRLFELFELFDVFELFGLFRNFWTFFVFFRHRQTEGRTNTQTPVTVHFAILLGLGIRPSIHSSNSQSIHLREVTLKGINRGGEWKSMGLRFIGLRGGRSKKKELYFYRFFFCKNQIRVQIQICYSI